MATSLDVYFADPHSPWQRPTNEKTNGIIRRYLPKGTEITDHQPYLTAIAEEINNQPRRCLGYRTPQEAFQRALTEGLLQRVDTAQGLPGQCQNRQGMVAGDHVGVESV